MLSRQHAVAACRAIAIATAIASWPTAARAEASLHRIRYRLAWSRTGTRAAADGGWDVVSDRGFRVHVARGYVTSFSMELVECSPSPLARLTRWLEPASAFAWHSANMVNPATVRSAPIESLTALRDQDAGAVTLPPQAYCQVHYLVARATPDSRGLPADVDVVDRSLVLDGVFRAPGTDDEHPLHVATASPNALLQPIPRVDVGEGDVTVVLRRTVARLFDGIDLAAERPAVIENRLVENLVHATRIKVRVARRG